MAEIAKTRKHPRVSSIWIIPGLAIAIGLWMLINGLMKQDIVVNIRFSAAQGIAEGRTKIKSREIEIGIVESIKLSEDFSEVIVRARIDRDAEELLRDDARFWVVKPRIGVSGISGVNTLISGVYIELDPGKGFAGQRSFTGLDEAPVTTSYERGLRVLLSSNSVGTVQVSDPVLYRGRTVGKVVAANFNPSNQLFEYDLHISEPFDQAVSSNTRFWKANAISLEATTEGFSFSAESLESFIAGGIAFDLPKKRAPGRQVEDGRRYKLYADQSDIDEFPYNYYLEYLVLFNSSVRGLFPDASVEYRGIKVGHVVDVSFEYLEKDAISGTDEIPVPALIRIFPGHLNLEDSPDSVESLREIIESRVSNGLKAELAYASFITQSLYVSLDYFEKAENDAIGSLGEYATLPTQGSGIELIEKQVVAILDQLASLPLKEAIESFNTTATSASETMASLKQSVESLNSILENQTTQDLPQSITETLSQVSDTLRVYSADSEVYQNLNGTIRKLESSLKEFEQVMQNLDQKPSSLIFSKPAGPDPEPKAARK